MTVYNPRTVEKERVMSERLQIYGEVIVRQGRKIIFKARNKFVGQALITLCNMFSKITITNIGGTGTVSAIWLFGDGTTTPTVIGQSLTMRLGTNTTTPTAFDMIALQSIINVAPNSLVITRDNPSAGVYRAIYTATWNSGTISGTVGEIGLFCNLQKTLGSNVLTTIDVTSTLWSRLSSASGDFSQFTIDPTKPLSVEWRIVFQF